MGNAASGCCANDEKPAAVEDINAGFNGHSVVTTQKSAISNADIKHISVGSSARQCVDLTYTGSSLSLLRGIFLRTTLRSAGSLWRHKPTHLTDAGYEIFA